MARIKLKYVNGFSSRDRKSHRVRYYFRRRGIKAIPLSGGPGSEEFMAAYSAALASVPDEHLEIGANRTLIQKPSAKRSWLKTIRGLMRAAVPTMPACCTKWSTKASM
jgi:hypothetical protein